MYNAPQPKLEDLPSNRQLGRMSVVAAIGAAAIGVMVYLPAEYGIDPTGVGSVLGLTEMGEIKQQLAKEAAEDEKLHGTQDSSSMIDGVLGLFVSSAHAQDAWKDVVTFTLEPGAYTEIKATMEKGATLTYAWMADGGRINFDLHAHAGGENVTYEKGRGETSGAGSFETPFAGDHGWFWRNRDKSAVTVTLQLRGDYSGLVRSD
ncbi:transmembrane anchor protein [Labrenzia sp. R4_2]|uniref:transmembrane anchor protein n=1 Tax=Labrenzia sp. R4_2 TaxID=2821107 RepID=UPI001ADB68B6|nr:transmembrane anchor protein [Labrenzia sp. R4_2]MBO9417883.1 transmembrane anchor protein [Labrenzia sp. R4_2]